MGQAHPVAQAGLVGARLPQATVAGDLPLAIGLEVAVVTVAAQVEVQAAHRRALGQADAHLGLLALGQQLDVVIQVDFLRAPARPAQRQHDQARCPLGGHLHTHSSFSLRGKSGNPPSHPRARCLR